MPRLPPVMKTEREVTGPDGIEAADAALLLQTACFTGAPGAEMSLRTALVTRFVAVDPLRACRETGGTT